MARLPFLPPAVRRALASEEEIHARLAAAADRRARRAADGAATATADRPAPGLARTILAARRRRAGLAHLSEADLQRLAALRDGVRLVALPDADAADAVAAALHAGMPWMAPATEAVWQALRRTAARGAPIRLPPLLLVGPPGIGKTVWVRRLAAALGLPMTTVEAGSEGAGFGIAGLQAGWREARPGRALELVLASRCGNPLILVDEVEKAGRVTASSGAAHDLAAALLPLLEPASARQWSCPCWRIPCDMSAIGWVLAANGTRGLPEPLLSRCRLVRLGPLARADLAVFAAREAERRGLSAPARDALRAALEAAPGGARLSLRSVLRLIETAETLETRPLLH